MSDNQFVTLIFLSICMIFTYVTTWVYVMLIDKPNKPDYFRASTIFISLLWCIIGMIIAFSYLFNHISKL